MELLDIRFQVRMTDTIKSTIEDIDDLQHLKQLRRAAVQLESLEEFKSFMVNNIIQAKLANYENLSF